MFYAPAREPLARAIASHAQVMLGVLAMVVLLLPALVTAAPNAESPPNKDGPTVLAVDLWALELYAIDDNDATFHLEARLKAQWLDPRLAFDPVEAGIEERHLQGAAVDEALKSEVWWPNFEIVDARDSRDRLHVSMVIASDGTVTYTERFKVAITQEYDLENFPFDEHDISFSIEPFVYNTNVVRFVRAEDAGGTLGREPDEWAVSDPKMVVTNEVCSQSSDTFCSTDADCPQDESCNVDWARVSIEMHITRQSKHYLSNIVFPMMLIVLISSAVFSMRFDTMHLGDRLGVSFTSVLTVVAFDFVTSESLPRLWYSTTLDNILTLSYAFLALNVFENVLAAHINTTRPAAAAKLDTLFRWGFPISYIVIVILIIGVGNVWG